LKSVILASASPRRQTLLRQLNISFVVDPSNINEEAIPLSEPEEYAKTLAFRKAEAVSKRHRNALIIGADTIVVQNNTILGKPVDEGEAFTMLRTLSNSRHEVITGLCLLTTDMNHRAEKTETIAVTTRVHFDTLTDQEIRDYISTGSPFDKAGGYGIQDDQGALFVKGIEGDFYNVVGFPINSFYRLLKSSFQEFLPFKVTSH